MFQNPLITSQREKKKRKINLKIKFSKPFLLHYEEGEIRNLERNIVEWGRSYNYFRNFELDIGKTRLGIDR